VVASSDGVTQATELIDAATGRGVPLRLLGGLAVRVLTPDFPPRARDDQDLDFASVGSAKKPLIELFGDLGYQGDARFNTLHGDHQMYFRTPDGSRAVDVIMNQLTMCHTLGFRDRLTRMPYTLDVTDLLLTKLQVVEQNEKDAQDIIYLLSAFGAGPGDEAEMIGLDRIAAVIGSDWGWWRTVTGSLDRVAELAAGSLRRLVPANARHDPAGQARALRAHAEACPKTMRWKMRARVGERVRWYELPEEVAH
jgi:hypothetical protein